MKSNNLDALFADAEPLPDQSRGLNQPVLTTRFLCTCGDAAGVGCHSQ